MIDVAYKATAVSTPIYKDVVLVKSIVIDASLALSISALLATVKFVFDIVSASPTFKLQDALCM